jgi:hypothetical protein
MEVKCATSFDERFDPANVMDQSNPSKFWISTGLYPQEIMIAFAQPKSLSEIKFQSTGGKFSPQKLFFKFNLLFSGAICL